MNTLLMRTPTKWMSRFACNPDVQQLGKLHWIGQDDPVSFQRSLHLLTSVHQTVSAFIPNPEQLTTFKAQLGQIHQRHPLSNVLAMQKLIWYADVTEQFCRDKNIPLLWCEEFIDGRVIADRVGLQYCRYNELTLDTLMPVQTTLEVLATREAQPSSVSKQALFELCGNPDPEKVVVVTGQVGPDMALRQYPGLGYLDWLHALFTRNPTVLFLFKPHPLEPTVFREKYTNVKVINVNLVSLFEHMRYFASFSSTTIFEGMCRGCKFATGGYHFCSAAGLTLQIHKESQAENLIEKLRTFVVDQQVWSRRWSFIHKHYAMPLESPRFVKRLLTTSQEFFQKGG